MTVQSGGRTFIAASVVLILFGMVHLLAVYHGNFRPPSDERTAEIKRLMMEHTQTIGPFTSSAWGAVQILSCSYSVFLIHVGILNLLMLRPARQSGRLRALTACDIVLVALLLIITILFQFPPPMAFAAVSLVLFGVSWWKQGAQKRQRPH